MSICSKHLMYDEHCNLCNAHPRDMTRHDGTKMFPDWDKKVAEAKTAGLVTCGDPECKFEFYLTTPDCPLCGKKYEVEALQLNGRAIG